MPWKKGQSGNPKGRKPGSGEVAKLRAALKPHLPAVLKKLAAQAKEGDVQAIKLLLERTVPPYKQTTEPVIIAALADAETPTDKAKAVIDAIADGQLPPDIGAGLLAALGNVVRIIELDELERRIAALEQADHADD